MGGRGMVLAPETSSASSWSPASNKEPTPLQRHCITKSWSKYAANSARPPLNLDSFIHFLDPVAADEKLVQQKSLKFANHSHVPSRWKFAGESRRCQTKLDESGKTTTTKCTRRKTSSTAPLTHYITIPSPPRRHASGLDADLAGGIHLQYQLEDDAKTTSITPALGPPRLQIFQRDKGSGGDSPNYGFLHIAILDSPCSGRSQEPLSLRIPGFQ